ncbi:hypothetical protein LguiB_034918 [Lonicera macranthoides]
MAEQDQDNHLLQYAMELASASALPMVLRSTIELGVLEIVAKAGPTALPSHPSRLLYGLVPVVKYFIRNEDGASSAPLLDAIQASL